jgi:hypothetical protein
MNGSIRFKARLVARGYNQEHGLNYFESYAPTLSLTSLRLLIGLASRQNLKIHNLDITTAYLYAKLDAIAYLKWPPGLDPTTMREKKLASENNLALKLLKGIYGLV